MSAGEIRKLAGGLTFQCAQPKSDVIASEAHKVIEKQCFSTGGQFAPQGTFGKFWKHLGFRTGGWVSEVLLASSG